MIAAAKRNLVNAIIAGGLLIALAHLGVSAMLGAHPLWAQKVSYFGVCFGIVVYALSWVWQGGWGGKAIAFIVLLLAGAGVTYYGKLQFVASYGDDALAGRMWYFGWIAVVAFAFAVLMHLLSTRR